MRRSHARTLLLAVLGAALLVAAGCGSKSGKTARYNGSYKAASTHIQALGDELGVAITSSAKLTDAQIVSKFGSLARRAHAAAAALLALNPPASLKPDNTALSTALDTAASDLDAIAAAGKSGNAKAATAARKKLVTDSVPVKAARMKLDAATK